MWQLVGAIVLALALSAEAQVPRTPNLIGNIDRPLRYRPDGGDFVIENGAEFFNRPLYGGNTAFRVDGGDKPEFVLYLPGRGGNLRFGLRKAGELKWLHDAAAITTRYRPGTLHYEIRDPLLGPTGWLRIAAVACPGAEALLVRCEAANVSSGIELIWAFGGVNGERGKRDGDIGTESVPISQWFQLRPEFARGNAIDIGSGEEGRFVVRAKPAAIAGVAPAGTRLAIGNAANWNRLTALFANGANQFPGKQAAVDSPVAEPVVLGSVALERDRPLFLSLQRVPGPGRPAQDLETYRAVTSEAARGSSAPTPADSVVRYGRDELPGRFVEAERHFESLRTRVTVDTPDPFFNTAVGALNVAADAVWDEPQQAIMHGAIAWRTRLLGWRGPYALDALGWHDRARRHFTYWAGRQNQQPPPEQVPPADENANLARNEAGLHSEGDLSNSHYDMNLVYIDALLRHLQWTGDRDFAREMWPVIVRHLAWEQRLFRCEFGTEKQKLPLYEAYAAIWASDDLQYHGGGVMHASAYNYYHHQQAARLARLLGANPVPFQREAQLLERGMRAHLWLPDRGWFAEFKDLLGLQRVHPSAGLWTFYHTMDSEVPTAAEAWQMTRQVETQIPHLPVRGSGVPSGSYTLSTTDWMPYRWSINNVVLAEVAHTALGFWQAGRPEPAWRMLRGALLAAMFMGISPGNVGSMSYLDVYRRESQRDFADGCGVLARAIVEGVFGVRPDALEGELRVTPGWPADWDRAAIRHPDFNLRFERRGDADTYVIEQRLARPLGVRLRLTAPRDRVASVTVDGRAAQWHRIESAIGAPKLEILPSAGPRHAIAITWAGDVVKNVGAPPQGLRPVRRQQGDMRWIDVPDAKNLRPVAEGSRLAAWKPPPKDAQFEPVNLADVFNDRVPQIFGNEYRAPRSPHVSLAIPKQGLGGWAGGVNATAEIDDRGLRETAAGNGGRILLPGGAPFVTPGGADEKNVVYTSLWENYPPAVAVLLSGSARHLLLLMAGSTNHMQSRFENGEVVVTYEDGGIARLPLENPTTWWPIEQDYFIDDYQFRFQGTLPVRVDLKTGAVRVLDPETFKGRGGMIRGGAATVLELSLDPGRRLQSLTVRTLANEVVVGLLAATLVR